MSKKKKSNQPQKQSLTPDKFIQQKARSLDIWKCWISKDFKKAGEGIILISRLQKDGKLCYAGYLVDIYCVGVKDTYYDAKVDQDVFKMRFGKYEDMMIPCTYDEAHNWIYGALEFAEEAGIAPHKDFAVTRYMLEEDTDAIPLIEYEFGKDGKHFLIAKSEFEASRYLPSLKKNVPGKFDYVINVGHDPMFDDGDDFDDDYDVDYDGDDGNHRRVRFNDNLVYTEYSYCHPDYPKTLRLEGPDWLYKELYQSSNAIYLEKGLVDDILNIPKDVLRHDLEQIILYHIGQTCDDISDEYDKEGFTGIIGNSLVLLGEVGNESSSLDVVLEVLRQSEEFSDYHFADSGEEYIAPTIYLLGNHQLARLMDFMKEEGLLSASKWHVMEAVAFIAIAEPFRRTEVLEWFRELLRYAKEHVAEAKSIDSELAGMMLSCLIEFNAEELLPEVKALYDTQLVDEGLTGDYEETEDFIMDPLSYKNHLLLDVYQRFAKMKELFDS